MSLAVYSKNRRKGDLLLFSSWRFITMEDCQGYDNFAKNEDESFSTSHRCKKILNYMQKKIDRIQVNI